MANRSNFNKKFSLTGSWLFLAIACSTLDVSAGSFVSEAEESIVFPSASALTVDWLELYQQGMRLKDQKRYEEAIAEFNKALTINPDFWLIFIQLGDAYRELKQNEKAILYFTKAIEGSPDPPWDIMAYQFRSIAYASLKKYKEAMDDITEAIRLDPTRGVSYYKRGQYYLLVFGEPDRALKDFDRAIEFRERTADAYYYRGSALKKLGRFQEAVDSYSEALKINPSDYYSLIHRAGVYLCLGEDEKALRDQNAILEKNPEDVEVHRLRVSVYMNKKDYKAALSDLFFAKQYGVEDSWIDLTLASIYYRLGEFEKAIEANEKAINLNDKPYLRPSLFFQKGLLLLINGDAEKARKAYDQGIKFSVEEHNLQSLEMAIRDIKEVSLPKEEVKKVAPEIIMALKETQTKVAPSAVTAPTECHKSRI